jgi:processive 1,2-diacylglycerol beta-glucosyltransferase
MPARVLVLSAAVGAGHVRAAQAVELALHKIAPDAIVRNVDVLTLTNAVFRRLYGTAYLDMVNHAPHVLGYFYDLLDRPRPPKSTPDRLRLVLEKLNLRKFAELLHEESWDVVVNTHFLPAEIIASLRRNEKISTPQITVTTDFETHRLWVHSPCEQYCAATDESAEYLVSWGVSRDKIRVTGIPIHPIFSEHKDRAECVRLHELDGDRPIVVQLAGGFGVGPIAKLFAEILSIRTPLQIVVAAGKNEKVQAQIKQIEVPERHKVKILGFTDKIDELMTAADVVVSKPGGLTSSEILARGAALAIVNPIPGQESRNSDYLLENGAAIKINNAATLSYKLQRLLDDPKGLARIKAKARQISKPQAAFDIAKMALEFASRTSGTGKR